MTDDDVQTSPWPDDLWTFGFFQDRDERLCELVELAEPEDWLPRVSWNRTAVNRGRSVLADPIPSL